MIRGRGIVVGVVFALGALLGLSTSAVFLDVDSSEIRASAETSASDRSGPIADLLIASLEEQDVFGRVADDIRADQIRNIIGAAAVAVAIAIALAIAFSRHRPPMTASASTVGTMPTLPVSSARRRPLDRKEAP